MKARTLFPLALSGLLLPNFVWGQVEVEILAAPDHVYSFEPVVVVAEARNEGPSGIAIPTEGCSGEGAYLEVGRVGEALEDAHPVFDCVPRRLVWLEPGGRWLFLQYVAPGAEGEFDIQAVLRSRGQCTGQPVGPHRKKIEVVREDHLVPSRPYDCWDGEVRSQRIAVTVVVPDSEVDVAAAGFLDRIQPSWRNNWKYSLIGNFRKLLDHHPTSHYTYAAFAAFGDFPAMLNAVILQPDNPLNPWVAGAMAAGLAYRHRPCASPYEERPGGPPDLAERYQRVIAAYPPPEPLRDYLRQQELEYASEDCPKKSATKQDDDAHLYP